MKILQVISTFYLSTLLGGGNSTAYYISKTLANKDHEVLVLTTNAYDKFKTFKNNKKKSSMKILF